MKRFRRGPSERGAALVEFALLLPAFAALSFGTLSGAQLYNQKLTITAAAREASRYAATLPFPSSTPVCNSPGGPSYGAIAGPPYTQLSGTAVLNQWLGCVEQAAVQTATGELAASSTGRSICIAYSKILISGTTTSTGSATFTTSDSSPSSTNSTAACDSSTLSGSDPQVQVVVKRTGKLSAVLYQTNLTMSASSVSRFER